MRMVPLPTLWLAMASSSEKLFPIHRPMEESHFHLHFWHLLVPPCQGTWNEPSETLLNAQTSELQGCLLPCPFLPLASDMEGVDDLLNYASPRGGGRGSTLVDDFERLTFEIQLNQAILRRSFSSPVVGQQHPDDGRQTRKRPPAASSTWVMILRKLLKPVYGVGLACRKKPNRPVAVTPRGAQALKAFSRSCRM